MRLRYRYLDVRRERMQRNLRVRARSTARCVRAMERQGFVEVETPMLMASTPEGAREFLVPSRQQPGSFYALPQSPQLFKQLLMVGGIDRYYQIARCLRDEDLRADRQYEFMQLDAEASFVDQDDVLEFISEAVLDAAEAVLGERPPAIERMTWQESMDRYGVDKPDLRFGMELVELTPVFAGTEFKAFAGAASIKGIGVPGRGDDDAQPARRDDRSCEVPRREGPRVDARCGDGGALESPVAKFLSDAEQAALVAALGVEAGDLVLIVADEWMTTSRCSASSATTSAGRPSTRARTGTSGSSTSRCSSGMSEDGHPKPAHHPFTPAASRRHRPARDPTRCRCAAAPTTSC